MGCGEGWAFGVHPQRLSNRKHNLIYPASFTGANHGWPNKCLSQVVSNWGDARIL